VRYEKVSQSKVSLQLGEKVDDLCPHADVEGGHRLVGHDELRMQRQGAGNANALALSSAEFVGEALQDRFVEADGAEEFDDAGASSTIRVSTPRSGSVWVSVNEEGLGDDLFDAETGIERGERILKDDLHIAA
jgi:hypothetical protein